MSAATCAATSAAEQLALGDGQSLLFQMAAAAIGRREQPSAVGAVGRNPFAQQFDHGIAQRHFERDGLGHRKQHHAGFEVDMLHFHAPALTQPAARKRQPEIEVAAHRIGELLDALPPAFPIDDNGGPAALSG